MGAADDDTLSSRELDLQLLGNRSRDLVLNREHVFDDAVVALGPHLIAILRVDERRGDADPLAGAPHTAFDDGADVQLLTHLLVPDHPSLELKRRAARDDAKPGSLASALMMSSVTPSAKNSPSSSRFRVAEGQDDDRRQCRHLLQLRLGQSGLQISRRPESFRRTLSEALVDDQRDRWDVFGARALQRTRHISQHRRDDGGLRVADDGRAGAA